MTRPFATALPLLLALLASLSAQAGELARLLDKPVPGGVAVVDLGAGAARPSARYQGKPVLVVQEDRRWLAVAGVPLTVKPGSQQLETGDGRRLAFAVRERHYKEQHITLKNTEQVNPSPANLARIEGELAQQNDAYRQFSPRQPGSLRFDKPVSGPLSSPFGLRRFFNGEERNPHAGLDFAVPAGTPVKAPAAGRVVLIGDYFFNGRTVFVDHGQGLISMFCHLSQVGVKVGDELPRGAVLGKVGATGRATGPHLHWNLSLNDARIDPAIFIGAYQP
ncbi:MAG TPA: peptidoglycan DD-metalloendopeptidase family protein [Pseudomonas sp.]|nr:peptidoglycan DD-metalloendopeptidase family protein [Pseudomonas sp.]